MSGLLVPDDWVEAVDGFCTMEVSVPNSTYWRANIRGAIQRLTFPYVWDAETGDSDQAALTAQDAFDSISFTCP